MIAGVVGALVIAALGIGGAGGVATLLAFGLAATVATAIVTEWLGATLLRVRRRSQPLLRASIRTWAVAPAVEPGTAVGGKR